MANVVGWVAGPTERGTLTVIWSCVLTIFACTWTVLHLNVPDDRDRPLQRVLRKIKWMVLNILFPEFILSKAICDLLLAIQELQEFRQKCEKFEKMNKHITWTDEYEKTRKTVRGIEPQRWSWKVAPLPPLLRFLWHFTLRGRSKTAISLVSRSQRNSLNFDMEAPRSSIATDLQEVREQGNRQSETNLVSKDHERMKREPEQTPLRATGPVFSEECDQQSPRANIRTNLNHGSLSGRNEGGEINRFSENYQTQLNLLMKQSEKRHEKQDDSGPSSMQMSREGSPGCLGAKPPEQLTAQQLGDSIKQEWTLVHSYYAQMGGLLYREPGEPDGLVFTASHLTSRHTWDWENGGTDEHPLMRLVLGKEDIEDKSKADWLSKGLAILQGLWFIFNVIARHVAGLSITPIEIATVAFSIMAVLIYLANWWKPKDVYRSTYLRFRNRALVRSEDQLHDRRRSFVSWLLNPGTQSQELKSRVHNDVVWLEGDTPLFLYLMGGSSLIFGGLHCLAWNYGFPTQAELYCWRIASLVSAVLPVVALLISAIVVYLAGSFSDHQIRSAMLDELQKFEPLGQLTNKWWEILTDGRHGFWRWEYDAKYAFVSMPKESRNWEEKPATHIIAQCKRNDEGWSKARPALWQFIGIHLHLSNFRKSWVYASEGRNDQPDQLRGLWERAGRLMREKSNEHPLDFWCDFEKMVSKKAGFSPTVSIYRPDNNGKMSYLEQILEAFNKAKAVFSRAEAFSRRWSRVSRVISIVSVIFYATARVIIIIFLFTSFRAAPTGVYQNTVWTRFLPNIS